MTLRQKTLLIMLATLAGLIVLLFLTSRTILQSGFATLERKDMTRNAEILLSTIENQIAVFGTQVRDWSSWDDTYQFMNDANQKYIKANLINSTYETLHIDLIVFIDTSGSFVFASGYDHEHGKEIPVLPHWPETVSRLQLLFKDSDAEKAVEGIIMVPEGPMIVGACPILTSHDEGPVRGTLLMGRLFDREEIEGLSTLTHLPLKVVTPKEISHSPDFRQIDAGTLEDTGTYIEPLNGDTLSGYFSVPDITGAPALIFRIDRQRDIYRHGQMLIRGLFVGLAVVAVIFSVITLFLLERSILSRLSAIREKIRCIGASTDLSDRVTLGGRDELAVLAGDINRMLGKLEASDMMVRRSEERYRTFVEHSIEAIWRFEFDTPIPTDCPTDRQVDMIHEYARLAECNPRAAELFGYDDPRDITGTRLSEFRGIPAVIFSRDRLRLFVDSGYRVTDEEISITGPGGEVKHLLSTAVSVVQKGFLLRCWGIQRDITRRRRMEDDLHAHREHLQLINKILRHDVINDLTVIGSAINLYRDSRDETLLDDAEASIRKSVALIRRMRELESFISLYKDLTILNLNDIIGEVHDNYPFIQCEGDGECRVFADESLRSVLDNIVRNAVIHGKTEKITLSVKKDGRFCEVRIADAGTGIPDKLKERVFEEGISYGTAQNSGLGLFIVKKAMDAYGGYAFIEDNIPSGCVVVLKLRRVV